MCGADDRFVDMSSAQEATFNTRDLSAYKRGTVFEILRTILRPHFELPMFAARLISSAPAIMMNFARAWRDLTQRGCI